MRDSGLFQRLPPPFPRQEQSLSFMLRAVWSSEGFDAG